MSFLDHFLEPVYDDSTPRRLNPLGILVLCSLVFAVITALAFAFGVHDDHEAASNPPVSTTTAPAVDPTTSTTAPTTTFTTIVTDDGGDAEVDYWLMRGTELQSMTDEDCLAQDHFAYLGLTETDMPRSYPDDSFFHFDCGTGYWGWYFQGAAGDTWQASRILLSDLPLCDDLPAGELCHAMLSLDKIGVPTNLHHPYFEDALTLSEIHAGDTVCLRTMSRTPGKPSLGETLTIESVGTSAYVPHDSDKVTAYPAYRPKTDDGEDTLSSYRSAEDDGLAPFSNGLWSTDYVTAGDC